jgi:hypothetical protein
VRRELLTRRGRVACGQCLEDPAVLGARPLQRTRIPT